MEACREVLDPCRGILTHVVDTQGVVEKSRHTVEYNNHVVDDRHVVEACRGGPPFSKACRGDGVSMSWTPRMSWKHVVENTQFRGDVVGTG